MKNVMAISMCAVLVLATSAPNCANLSYVLNLGQQLVTKQHCRGVKDCAHEAAKLGHPLQTPALGGCARALRLPFCSSRTAVCHSLETLLAEVSPRQYQSCGKHKHQCNPPHGRCEQFRCACNVIPMQQVSYGGAQCEVDNVARLKNLPTNPKYAENIYAKNYVRAVGKLNSSIGDHEHLGSGAGSSLATTFGIRTAMPHLVELLQIKTIFDVPCGDFNYFRDILKDLRMASVHYIGADIVQFLVDALNREFYQPNRVEFMRFDLSLQALWPVDLVVIRDVLFHFNAQRALDVLRNVNQSGAKYLLTTYFPDSHANEHQDRQFKPGRGFRSFMKLNLEDAPFSLRPPMVAIGHDSERLHDNRVLGLWRLPLQTH